MRSAFSLSHCTRYPPFCGAEPKRRRRLEEASTHKLMTLTDIKRPQAIAAFSTCLVYQVSSGGVGVAGHPHALKDAGDACLGCWTPGRARREGEESRCLARNDEGTIHPTGHPNRALEHLVRKRRDYR